MIEFDKGACKRMGTDGRTLFEPIYHNTSTYAVDRQPLFVNISKDTGKIGKFEVTSSHGTYFNLV